MSDQPASPLYDQQKALNRQFKRVNEALHDLAWTLEDLERRLGELEAAQQTAPNTDEAQLIETLRHQRSDLEEQILSLMIEIDTLQAQLKSL